MTQKLLTPNTEKLAQKFVKTLLRRGFGPYRAFAWSLEIARTCEKGLGKLEYEKTMEFLLESEWMYKNAKGDFVITEWGASEALGIS